MNTIGDFLQQIATQYGSSTALQTKVGDNTEVWTYSDLLRRVDRLSLWFSEQGIEKGDRIIIWAPNGPWWATSYFGILRLGAILIPLDAQSGADYVQRVVDQTEPKLAILSRQNMSSWTCETPTCFIEDFASLPEKHANPPNSDVHPDDIAEIMFTSGSTGNPKGVILTHSNILSNVESTNHHVPKTKEFRIISLLPLSHMMAQSVDLLLAMKRRASIYYVASRLPATIFAALKEHGATTMLLVPQVLQLFMSSIEREIEKQGKQKEWERARRIARFLPMWLRRRLFRQVHERLGGMVEFLISGGAALDSKLIHKWELLGVPIIRGYGATEAGPIISTTLVNERNQHTVGKPVPGVQVKIASDGEVLIKGPNVTPGYWHNPQMTEESFEDGWYKTGDLGYLDSKGKLYLHGRKKDMIALPNGENVYPLDVEQALVNIEGVKDAAVIGLPSEGGQQVHAVVLPISGMELDLDRVVREANGKLVPHQRIKSATIWPETDFPRTFTLKIKKHEVLKAVVEIRERENEAKERANLSAKVV